LDCQIQAIAPGFHRGCRWIWQSSESNEESYLIHVTKLTQTQRETILVNEERGLGICAISLWEVAKLVGYKRLELPCGLEEWLEQALSYPGMSILELTPEIAIESTRLPGEFHRDPADQMIVATARVHHCPLVTSDEKILRYTHVETVG
jgi:PIN domain nuclease of toxin-antitoxin system